MNNIDIEIEFYKECPNRLRVNRKHLISLYGNDGWKQILNSISSISPKKRDWRKYESLVRKLTEEQPLETLENYDKRGFKNMHVDHRVSIWNAYRLGWTPEQCADISNLKMIPYKENMIKGIKNEHPN